MLTIVGKRWVEGITRVDPTTKNQEVVVTLLFMKIDDVKSRYISTAQHSSHNKTNVQALCI